MAGLLDNNGSAGLLGNFQRGLAQIAHKDPDEMEVKRRRQMILRELGPGASLPDVARRLAQIGDIDGFQALTRMADVQSQRDYTRTIDQRNFDWQKAEAARTQSNADRSFDLQRQLGTEKPQVIWQEDDSGNKVPYLVPPMGQGNVRRMPVEGEASQPTNPFAQGKMNEAQSKDGLYASRMLMSERILRDPKVEAAAQDSSSRMMGAISERIPFGLARHKVPEAFQKFDQAKRDFINATLRRESGAVISPAEFDNAEKQYFPAPGDTPEVLTQKRANREEAIKGIAAGAGKGYRPPLRFDESGGLVPNRPDGGGVIAPPKAAGGLPRVSSPEEARKLPKGTKFLDPNGVERVVP